MLPNVSIIVPVYNAFEEALRCAKSVLKFTPEAQRIYFIDDCSPSGDFAQYLQNHITFDKRLHFQRNPSNMGFVRTCNLGMQLSAPDDVVLLNSDTEVTSGWLEKMRRAACSDPQIGTVTPLTNNGVICSVPNFCLDNEIPQGYSIDQFAALVEMVSKRSYPKLPTAVGFCMYIRRQVLDQIGLFDAEAFGLGNGEENDLSCRLQQAGYFDILDDATFIFHKGNMSFGASKELLVKRNSEVLRRRHPHYFDDVAKFCAENPLKPVQRRINDELVKRWHNTRQGQVLHILHNGPYVERHGPLGGTELSVRAMLEHDKNFAHWSMVPTALYYYLTAHLPGLNLEYVLERKKSALNSILLSKYFDLIHLQHSRWLDHSEMCQALQAHGNYLVSMHDFLLVCPRFHLYTPKRRACNGHECHSSCGYKQSYIADYRSSTSALLSQARSVISFSDSTQKQVQNIIEAQIPWRKIQHGIVNVNHRISGNGTNERPRPGDNEPLRVAFLGYLPQHKGAQIIAELVQQASLPNATKLEWHIIGKLFVKAGKQVIQHGAYQATDLYKKLCSVNPHLVLILSTCPETYCLTLDEAWNAGIPVVVTPLGAPPERVQASGAGWVLQSLDKVSVLEMLQSIVDNWDDYNKKVRSLDRVKLKSLTDEMAQLSNIYSEHCEVTRQSDITAWQLYLEQFANPPMLPVSGAKLLLGKVLNRLVFLLDELQLRSSLQTMANRIVPRQIMENLKLFRHSV